MIKSHEYVSKVILKNFSFKKCKEYWAYYVKLPNTKIRCNNIKKINIREGAFSEQNETILDTSFESFLGNLSAECRNGIKQNGSFSLKGFHPDNIKEYFVYQAIRDDEIVMQMQNSNLSNILPQNHAKKLNYQSILRDKNYLISTERTTNLFHKTFEDSSVIVLTSSYPFLCSSYITNLSSSPSQLLLVLPLHPNICLILTNHYNNLAHRYVHIGSKVIDANYADFINRGIIKNGLNTRGIIASQDKNFLKKYLNS